MDFLRNHPFPFRSDERHSFQLLPVAFRQLFLDDLKNFNIAQKPAPPFRCLVLIKKGKVKIMPVTRIDFNSNKIAHVQDLDELAALLFPGNTEHQKVFLAIFIELKYVKGQFIAYLLPLCEKYGFTARMLETAGPK